jgi:CubicO group peptidase (beta-lactamase class C family)
MTSPSSLISPVAQKLKAFKSRLRPGSPPIEGHVAPGFEPVADAFRQNFIDEREVGASFCAFHEGKKVIDLWGGYTDQSTRTPWQQDTVAFLFSATKGLAAMTVLALAKEGLIDYDAPVSQYWPAFAAAGKQHVTVRTLMNHRAGLHAVQVPITLADLAAPGRCAPALETQAPLWAPGSDQGYHAVSFGLYVGELVRRIAGKRLGLVFEEWVTRPLGLSNDLWIGTPESAEPRVARLYPADAQARLTGILPRIVSDKGYNGRTYRAFINPKSDSARAFSNPKELGARFVHRYGTREIRALDLPWCSAVGNARSLASAYAGLLGIGAPNAVPLVPRDLITPIMDRQSWTDHDRVLHKPLGFSQGFLKDEPHLFSPHLDSFGHAGAGGILGWAVPSRNLAFGYVMNRMDFRVRSPRAIALAQALHRVIG